MTYSRKFSIPESLRVFNREYQLSDAISFKQSFCKAAGMALESYISRHAETHPDSLSIKLKNTLAECKSYRDISTAVICFSKKQLISMVKEKMLDPELGKLINYLRYIFTSDSHYSSLVLAPDSAFELKAIGELGRGKTITNGEFSALILEDFIQFHAHGVKTDINDIKLRISIDEKAFANAWDLIKSDLLSAESPIYNFKITHSKFCYDRLLNFNKKFANHLLNKKECKEDTSLPDKVNYDATVLSFMRLIKGGQITLYLPRNVNDEILNKIASFLDTICKTLIANNIEPGILPTSDQRITSYLSASVWAIDSDYISPEKRSDYNKSNPVIKFFSEVFAVKSCGKTSSTLS